MGIWVGDFNIFTEATNQFMTISEQISDVFTGFHDGTIMSCRGIENGYRFTVDCLYLAGRLNPDFEVFYVDVFDVVLISFDPWIAEGQEIASETTFEDIFLYEPEIGYSDEKNGEIIMSFRIDDVNAYVGATVTFTSSKIVLYDQNNQILELDDFFRLVRSYWDSFGKI